MEGFAIGKGKTVVTRQTPRARFNKKEKDRFVMLPSIGSSWLTRDTWDSE